MFHIQDEKRSFQESNNILTGDNPEIQVVVPSLRNVASQRESQNKETMGSVGMHLGAKTLGLILIE